MKKREAMMTTLTEPAVAPNKVRGDWNVEQFDDEGNCLMAIFTGPDAEVRAREYAYFLSLDRKQS